MYSALVQVFLIGFEFCYRLSLVCGTNIILTLYQLLIYVSLYYTGYYLVAEVKKMWIVHPLPHTPSHRSA
jgi:hypothetical protein